MTQGKDLVELGVLRVYKKYLDRMRVQTEAQDSQAQADPAFSHERGELPA